MLKRVAIFAGLVGLLGCSDGDFDQRMRADIDELRDQATIFVNTNPGNGSGTLRGSVSTGGPVNFARMTAHPVSRDGVVDFDESNALGDTFSDGGVANFIVTLREDYEGPVVLSARSGEFNGFPTTYASPARSETTPEGLQLRAGEELLGYVIDYPFIEDAVSVTPLSTLVVEKAIQMGGVSSANLSIAARQIGAIFGLFDARDVEPDNIVDSNTLFTEELELDCALALISQYALENGVNDAAVWSALRRDIRDDGEINGSAGLIDGTNINLADFSAPDFLGSGLLTRFLDADNANNKIGISNLALPANQRLADTIATLDSQRAISDVSLSLDHVVVLNPNIELKAGQFTSLGVRGFEFIDNDYYMAMSSDGPNAAIVDFTSNDLAVATFPFPGYVSVPMGAAVGSSTTVQVRIRPDGMLLTGGFDQTVTISVTVID